MITRLLFCAFIIHYSLPSYAQSLSLTNLRCEYSTNPIGIDENSPRFSWVIQSDDRDVMQTAYHIRVSNNENDLDNADKLIWDTGKITTDRSIHIVYSGPDLQSRSRYYWQVKIWDNHGNESGWSEPQYWEMGLLSPGDWSAEWIQSTVEEDISKSQPANMFRKEFELKENVARARLYITSMGLYEAEINGTIVGDQLFTPGWTSYTKRLQYQTYDVTDMLQAGDNALGTTVGDGWFRGFIGWSTQRNFYGDKLAFLCQLEVTYDDGTKQMIISDDSWKASTGPILFSDIYNGETYDARLEQEGWSKQDFTLNDWKDVKVVDHPKDILVAPYGPPVKRIQEITPVDLIKTPEGDVVFDMGQNMVGWVRLTVKGNAGQTVILHHAEVLDKEGNFYTDNLRSAKQQTSYTLKGGGTEVFEPRFTFQGFRYVRVQGISDLSADNITGIVIHSDMTPSGDFECSDPMINQLQHNIQWGQKGNFLDVPTDCPQRDERMGWTGDAQAFAPTAAFNMDVAAFFTKWLLDLAADQTEEGMVPYVIPNVLGAKAGGSTGWADAATIIPWDMYLAYGDKRILERQYESMKAWVKYMEDNTGDDGLWNTGFHFGDWLFYSEEDDRSGVSAITDKYLLAQAFFAHSAEIVYKTARVLGENEDMEYYESLANRVIELFRSEYVTSTGRLVSSTQTAYVIALKFGLLPDYQRMAAADRLVNNIERYENHLTTGFLGTPYLCSVLSQFGHTDKAYTLLEQKTYPSWLYPVTQGATTIWERWDGMKPDSTFQSVGMNSFNHYAYGAIGNWMYTTVAGINFDEENPGYKHIIISPQPGGTLTYANAYHNSMYGKISSGWKLEGGKLTIEVQIPHNTTATIILPGASMEEVMESEVKLKKTKTGIYSIIREGQNVNIEVGSGTYQFSYPVKINR